MATLFTPADMSRIFNAQPLSEVRDWLSFWVFAQNQGRTKQIDKLVSIFNSFGAAQLVVDKPFQLDIFVPISITESVLPFLVGTTLRFNISEVGIMSVRKPETLRLVLTGTEIGRPAGFPKPKPRP